VQPPQCGQPLGGDRVHLAKIGLVVEAAGAQARLHRLAADKALPGPLAAGGAEVAVVLHGDQRGPIHRPFQDGRIHHGVQVDDVRLVRANQAIDVGGLAGARLEPRQPVGGAGQPDPLVDSAGGDADLVPLGRRLQQPEQVDVGASPIRDPVREVQDPHRAIIAWSGSLPGRAEGIESKSFHSGMGSQP
jgi:hypothetical protein